MTLQIILATRIIFDESSTKARSFLLRTSDELCALAYHLNNSPDLLNRYKAHLIFDLADKLEDQLSKLEPIP